MKTAIALLFALATLALTGCNTIEGAGQDVERAGENISEAARDVDREI